MNRRQAWAEAAFKAIKAQQAKDEAAQGKYRTHCLKFPSLLLQSGLAQSLAFIASREDKQGALFVKDLAHAINEPNLLESARTAELDKYTRLSAMALGAAAWFRRFATELKKGDNE